VDSKPPEAGLKT